MKVLIVDDEVNILKGLSRMLQGQTDDWDIETATSGQEALEILRESRFDVFVSGIRMPEMDGGQLLKRVEQEFPQTLRIVLSGQADKDSVMGAIKPMHQYLFKPCQPAQLISAIRRAEMFHDSISQPEALDAIGSANCLPVLPQYVTDVQNVVNSPDCSLSILTEIIASEVSLVGKILQVANSALYGLSEPVVDLEHAISIIGLDMTESLALSLTVFSNEQPEVAERAKQILDYSLSVLTIGRNIVEWENASESCGVITTSCLLHDLGKIVLLNAFRDDYRDLEANCRATQTQPSLEEQTRFGGSHAGVGACLLQIWGIPVEIIETILIHHNMEKCATGSFAAQVVFAANWIAHGQPETYLESQNESAEIQEFQHKLMNWSERYVSEWE